MRSRVQAGHAVGHRVRAVSMAGVDWDGRGHVYAVHAVPPGRFIGELGAVLQTRPDGGLPLRLDGRGRPVIGGKRRRDARASARWVLAPLRYDACLQARLRSLLRRLVDAGQRPLSGPDGATPVGWLHAEPREDRLALWAAEHPVLDDVLLTTEESEAGRLGYGRPRRLGYVDALAPVTGTLGVSRPVLPWTDGWSQAGAAPTGPPASANRRA